MFLFGQGEISTVAGPTRDLQLALWRELAGQQSLCLMLRSVRGATAPIGAWNDHSDPACAWNRPFEMISRCGLLMSRFAACTGYAGCTT